MRKKITCFLAVACFLFTLNACTSKNKKSVYENVNQTIIPDSQETSVFTIPYDQRVIELPENPYERKTGDTFCGEYIYNDEVSLKDGITTSYDLNQLDAFFTSVNLTEAGIMYPETNVVSFSDVNAVFPVEIIRTHNYSVYKVTQGGYFYVFWAVSATDMDGAENPPVRFSAYISGDKTEEMFYTLRPDVNTAEDVKKLDPSAELRFDCSPFFSCSYINSETILRIYYKAPSSEITSNKDYWDYSDLVIEEMVFVRRLGYPSVYSSVLEGDLP